MQTTALKVLPVNGDVSAVHLALQGFDHQATLRADGWVDLLLTFKTDRYPNDFQRVVARLAPVAVRVILRDGALVPA